MERECGRRLASLGCGPRSRGWAKGASTTVGDSAEWSMTNWGCVVKGPNKYPRRARAWHCDFARKRQLIGKCN